MLHKLLTTHAIFIASLVLACNIVVLLCSVCMHAYDVRIANGSKRRHQEVQNEYLYLCPLPIKLPLSCGFLFLTDCLFSCDIPSGDWRVAYMY